LKNAFADAVRQAVGMMVDHETMIENEDVIKDQILTYSNGYVDWYEKTDQKVSADGIYTVHIFASVKRRNLHEKLKECSVSVADLDGESLFAEIITKKQASQDAAKLLGHVLEDVPLSLLEAKLTHEKPEVLEKYLDIYKLCWRIEIGFNEEKYYKHFLPELMNMLGKIADSQAASSFSYPVLSVLDDLPSESVQLWTPNYKRMKKTLPIFIWDIENPDNRTPKKTINVKNDLFVSVCINNSGDEGSSEWWWYVLNRSKYGSVFSQVQEREYILRIEFLDQANMLVHMDAISIDGINYKHNGIDNENPEYKTRIHDLFSYPMFERYFPGFITPHTYGINNDGLNVPWSKSISPFFKTCNSYYDNSYMTNNFMLNYVVEMPLSKMRNITKIQCKFIEVQ
jgi:hypothetical protein